MVVRTNKKNLFLSIKYKEFTENNIKYTIDWSECYGPLKFHYPGP